MWLLCSGKSQLMYETLFRIVIEKNDRMGISVDPTRIICDFEAAVVNAITSTFGQHVIVQGCCYHLCQNPWRKTGDLWLVAVYKDQEDIRLLCGMLDGQRSCCPVTSSK